MEIKVNFLDKLRLEAKFDDFTVVADQPIRYKGDGSAPGPFDYFLASSALCAAYFVKLYCDTRNIPTDNIRLSQNNIVDPENRYKQIFKIQVELPADISDKDRQGILRSIERCTVKKVVQTGPEFVIEEVENLDADAQALLTLNPASEATYILGKDLPLEQTIANMSGVLAGWASRSKSPRGAIWCPMCGRCISAMRIRRCALPMARARPRKAHWPRPWANISSGSIAIISTTTSSGAKTSPMRPSCITRTSAGSSRAARMRCRPASSTNTASIYNPDGELRGSHLYDTNSGNVERGICRCPMCASRTARWCISRPT
jgi:ribosomal protein S12 methylthiotransferase accessory factor